MQDAVKIFSSVGCMYSCRITQKEKVDMARVWRVLNFITAKGCKSVAEHYAKVGQDYCVVHPESVLQEFMRAKGVESHIFLYYRTPQNGCLHFSPLDRELLMAHCERVRDQYLKQAMEAREDVAALREAKAAARYWVDLSRALRGLCVPVHGRRRVLFGFALESMALFFWPVLDEYQGECREVVMEI